MSGQSALKPQYAWPAGCLLLALFSAGCGSPPDDGEAAAGAPLLTAKTLGEQVVLNSEAYLALPPYSDADLELGERQARVCRACHTLEAGGLNMIGPNLHGMFGRTAGSMPGYEFSDALSTVEFAWTPRALDAWLKAPARFLPGNRMSFAGVADAKRRDALIAYLIKETSAQADRES